MLHFWRLSSAADRVDQLNAEVYILRIKESRNIIITNLVNVVTVEMLLFRLHTQIPTSLELAL
jgi:hypothetical protein